MEDLEYEKEEVEETERFERRKDKESIEKEMYLM